jgi:hypothetical protein
MHFPNFPSPTQGSRFNAMYALKQSSISPQFRPPNPFSHVHSTPVPVAEQEVAPFKQMAACSSVHGSAWTDQTTDDERKVKKMSECGTPKKVLVDMDCTLNPSPRPAHTHHTPGHLEDAVSLAVQT